MLAYAGPAYGGPAYGGPAGNHLLGIANQQMGFGE